MAAINNIFCCHHKFFLPLSSEFYGKNWNFKFMIAMLLNNFTLYTDDQHTLYTAYHPSHANTPPPKARRSTLVLVRQLDCCLSVFVAEIS